MTATSGCVDASKAKAPGRSNIPRLTEDAVLEELLAVDPEIEVLFSSGYFAEDRTEGGTNLAGVISKPYLREELLRMVRQALATRSEMERRRESA